jgi:hypothetical protein
MPTVPFPPSPSNLVDRPRGSGSRNRLLFLLLILVWTGITAGLLYCEGTQLRGDHPLLFRVLTAFLAALLLVPLWFVRPRLPRRRGPRRSDGRPHLPNAA